MKNIKLSLLTLLICMVSTNLFAQQTTLEVDNQTPGWLSSKINFSDQLSLETLKITGYINTDDISFLEQLSTKRSLQVLDLEEVHLAPGGTYRVYKNLKQGIWEDDLADSFLYLGLQLRKLITPKYATYTYEEKNYYLIRGHSVDTLVIKGTNKHFKIDTSPCRKMVVFPEGTEQITFSTRLINCSFYIPSTLRKLHGCYISNSDRNNVNIISSHKDPSSIEIINDYTFSNANRLGGDTLWIPEGTKEKYMSTPFKNMKVILEMTPPTEIEIKEGEQTCRKKTLYKNDYLKLNSFLIPAHAYYRGVIWKSTNNEIVRVDQDGNVAALGAGNADIIVCSDKDEKIADTCHVDVFEHTTAMDISIANKEVNINESFVLSAYTLPSGTTDGKFTWSSSNEEIANVDNNGKVTGLKLGSCIITATAKDGGSKAECVVTVVQPAKELSLNKHTAIIKVGNTEELRATVSPETTTDKSVNWASMDNSIAEVNNNGVITGKKVGKVTIIAQATTNPEAKDYCEVTVLQPVTGIEIDKKSITFTSTGESSQLSATVKPDDASDKTVRWFSSNTAVCTVSESGVVIATGAGNAIVTATSVDGGFVAVCIVTVNESSGILDIEIDKLTGNEQIYDAQGKKQNSIKKGLNIIRMGDGTTRKVVVK